MHVCVFYLLKNEMKNINLQTTPQNISSLMDFCGFISNELNKYLICKLKMSLISHKMFSLIKFGMSYE